MGVNAVRTTHNMPAVELLELADEMGILIVDEAFDMWEMSKTTYDYARFFKEWSARDVKSWICRDRNHPCVILLVHSEMKFMTRTPMNTARKLHAT